MTPLDACKTIEPYFGERSVVRAIWHLGEEDPSWEVGGIHGPVFSHQDGLEASVRMCIKDQTGPNPLKPRR